MMQAHGDNVLGPIRRMITTRAVQRRKLAGLCAKKDRAEVRRERKSEITPALLNAQKYIISASSTKLYHFCKKMFVSGENRAHHGKSSRADNPSRAVKVKTTEIFTLYWVLHVTILLT